MRCEKCGKDFAAGLSQCPHCQAPAHYDGNTVFYGQAFENKLSLKDFFSNVFGNHPAGAGEKMFASGTALTTPTPDRMLRDWVRPWLYARFLIAGLLFTLLCYFLFNEVHIRAGMYMLFSFGCAVVPLAVLIFYWEINIPRDIPIYRVFLIFFLGGVMSLIFTGLLPSSPNTPAYMAPLTEEPAKILATAIFIYMMDSKRIFNGLLIGAAVGAGFAVFEDIQYVMHYSVSAMVQDVIKNAILQCTMYFKAHPDEYNILLVYASNPGQFTGASQEVITALRTAIGNASQYILGNIGGTIYPSMNKTGFDILVMRSIGTLGGHVTFAAIEGAALVMVKERESLQIKHFFDPRFLSYVGIVMGIHCIWNTRIKLYPLPFGIDLMDIILSIVAVFAAFTLIQKAVVQTLQDVDMASAGAMASAALVPAVGIKAVAGPIASAIFPLQERLVIGRDPAACNVLFPPGTRGVSRRHCTIEKRGDGVYLMDLGSSAGTFVNGNQRAPINQWIRLSGDFSLGSPQVMFSISPAPDLHTPPSSAPVAVPSQPKSLSPAVSLRAISGPLQGQNFSLNGRLTIGRDPTGCNVIFPPSTKGISRRHCVLEKRADGVYLMDIGSSAGTFLSSGQRLPLNKWIRVNGSFYLGSTAVMFRIE